MESWSQSAFNFRLPPLLFTIQDLDREERLISRHDHWLAFKVHWGHLDCAFGDARGVIAHMAS